MSQFIRKIIWHLCGGDNYCLDVYDSRQLVKQCLAHYYSKRNAKIKLVQDRKLVVAMCDGRAYHGGLSDRLRGITSLYAWCKEQGVDFKIHFNYPFPLSRFLIPNHYNWICTEEELSYNSRESEPLCIYAHKRRIQDIEIQRRRFNHIIKAHIKQFHVYSNTYLYDDIFKEMFHELFKPSELLQREIDHNRNQIGEKYIAVVYRFQQLLGDFREDGYKVLSEEQREILMGQCLKSLDSICYKMLMGGGKILVTSDSATFLECAKKKDFIYVISGKVVHMEYTTDASETVYLKSFVDLFMLSYAEKVYLVVGPDMYHSGFAQRGAMISGVPYEEIYI